MLWTQIGPRGKYTAIPGMDPRADWLFGPGLQDYLPNGVDKLIPFIMSLHDQTGVEFVQRLASSEAAPLFIANVDPSTLRPGDYFTAFSVMAFFEELAKPDGAFDALRSAAKEIKLGASLSVSKLPNWEPFKAGTRLADPPAGALGDNLPPQTVVMGIIDDGIAFAHERFRTKDYGSRVQSFWRQDPPDTSSTVSLGHEIFKGGVGGIDDLLAKGIDEDALYRSAELINFANPGHKGAAWRVAHGTHVLDLAAGAKPGDNVLDRPVIGVQLPFATTQDTSGGSDLTPMVLSAIDHILLRADTLGGGVNMLPVVINFSYGLIAGPHDGTSELERGIDQRIEQRPDKLRILLPAGNSHLSRCHAEVTFAYRGETVELAWRVLPDDLTPSLLEIWMPHAGASTPPQPRLRLSVVAPGGATQTALLGETHNTAVSLLDDNGATICQASYVFRFAPTERGRYLVELQPTARLQPTTAPIAPSGVWKVRLENLLLQPVEAVQAWIQRDDTAYGYPIRGRQSYFDQPCYVRFDAQGREIEEDTQAQAISPCHVTRASLINSLATGSGKNVAIGAGTIVAAPIVAGGYLRKELRIARYSAGEPINPPAGGTLPPNLHKPDATLVTDDSKVHSGVLAAGSRSGSRVAMNGTSVAAPTLARWVADQLAAGNPGDRAAVCAAAQVDEAALPASKPPLPTERGGCGRMRRDKPEYPHDR